ncbi:hypothetical protein CIHG_06770 [Coccidioides immitis H538.4]|uniref:Uncharacterized protein n=1 Tax=Coccidioides immitis H538.4 TaxID=396776 RepID=A0A0J8RXQ3_COCIT|nr:hypothetical protein CIHG_06770 [Coccidioides immitis H538.4]
MTTHKLSESVLDKIHSIILELPSDFADLADQYSPSLDTCYPKPSKHYANSVTVISVMTDFKHRRLSVVYRSTKASGGESPEDLNMEEPGAVTPRTLVADTAEETSANLSHSRSVSTVLASTFTRDANWQIQKTSLLNGTQVTAVSHHGTGSEAQGEDRLQDTQAELEGQDTAAVADTDPLVPFSHWITPQRNPRRFTTQMYLYFLPHSNGGISDIAGDTEVQVPSTDGGIEITEAQFLPATEWLRRARVGDIIMFPPQVLLLDFVAQFLDKPGPNGTSPQSISGEESTKRRAELVKFAHSGNPPWTHKFISPHPIGNVPDGRQILDLSQPGPELKGTDKKGEIDRVVLARFNKEGPREVEIRWRRDVLPDGPAKSSL